VRLPVPESLDAEANPVNLTQYICEHPDDIVSLLVVLSINYFLRSESIGNADVI
jgi:hypothetical protein